MRTVQIKLMAFIAVITFLISCADGQPIFVKRSTLEASEKENAQLRSSLSEAQRSFTKQNEELNRILMDISTISNETSAIYLNVETGASNRTVIESAQRNLNSIKDRINRLEQEANRARKLDKNLALAVSTIRQLRETVANHEKEIARLKEEVFRKEQTIKIQEDTIVSQKRALQAAIKDLSEQLYMAGFELEELADEGVLNVSGRRDKQTVKNYREKIYLRALTSFRKAAAQGHEGARDRITVVENKITTLGLEK